MHSLCLIDEVIKGRRVDFRRCISRPIMPRRMHIAFPSVGLLSEP